MDYGSKLARSLNVVVSLSVFQYALNVFVAYADVYQGAPISPLIFSVLFAGAPILVVTA